MEADATRTQYPEWGMPDPGPFVRSIERPVDPLADTLAAADFFGPLSRLEASTARGLPAPRAEVPRLENYLPGGLAILLLLALLVRRIRFRAEAGMLFRSLVMPGQFDALQENPSVAFRQFLGSSYRIALLAGLLIAYKWGLIWLDSPLSADLPDVRRPWLLPILIGAGLAVWLYKRILMGIISLLSGGRRKTGRIRHFNNFIVALASYALAPAAILAAALDPEQARWLFAAQVILLILCVLYYLAKSFSFFLSRDIPILQWILYLCAVEIWPFSFFLLFANRGFVW